MLANKEIDIAALSQTRLLGQGQLTEEGGGYTFFWKGKDAGMKRLAGVDFAVRTKLLTQINRSPKASANASWCKAKIGTQ